MAYRLLIDHTLETFGHLWYWMDDARREMEETLRAGKYWPLTGEGWKIEECEYTEETDEEAPYGPA